MTGEKSFRVSFHEMEEVLKEKLLRRGFSEEDAALSARLFTESSCDGVYSHGLNRFPKYIDDIENGYIKVDQKPRRTARNGVLEQWDGRLGPGNLNAWRSMERAVEIAHEHGMGCVALANTNHWLRGGSYGWKAADEECLAMLWSNTTGNMPPWGGAEPTIGNNPFILAVPRLPGHVVLDFSQSMYSYGKLSIYRDRGEALPFEGGFDREGRLTRDAGAIEESMRVLPAGLWKGSGLAMMLDLFATVLTGGNSTMEISRQPVEYAVSQVFIAISPDAESFDYSRKAILDQIIKHIKNTTPAEDHDAVRYPGEQTLETRKINLREGIPVQRDIWQKVQSL